ncbi:hypothetical protein VTN96DRAFT_6580 [Rasamsonia emersonii]
MRWSVFLVFHATSSSSSPCAPPPSTSPSPTLYSVQPFINAAGYGWPFVFFGLCVLLSMGAAIPMIVYGKKWRRRKAARYYRFLREVGREEVRTD